MDTISWIKLRIQMFDDEKIKIIESMPEGDSILIIWIKLLVQAGKNNAGGYIYLKQDIPFTPDMLATIFNRKITTVRVALDWLEKLGMIDVEPDGMILINNWEKHQNKDGLDKIREQARLRKAKQRERDRLLAESLDNSTTQDVSRDMSRNVTQQNKNKKEEKEKKEILKKEKKSFACHVTMTDEEYSKLLSAYPENFVKKCIEKLDNYKGASGRRYKSDYHAILTWVVDEIKKTNPVNTKNTEPIPPKPQRI